MPTHSYRRCFSLCWFALPLTAAASLAQTMSPPNPVTDKTPQKTSTSSEQQLCIPDILKHPSMHPVVSRNKDVIYFTHPADNELQAARRPHRLYHIDLNEGTPTLKPVLLLPIEPHHGLILSGKSREALTVVVQRPQDQDCGFGITKLVHLSVNPDRFKLAGAKGGRGYYGLVAAKPSAKLYALKKREILELDPSTFQSRALLPTIQVGETPIFFNRDKKLAIWAKRQSKTSILVGRRQATRDLKDSMLLEPLQRVSLAGKHLIKVTLDVSNNTLIFHCKKPFCTHGMWTEQKIRLPRSNRIIDTRVDMEVNGRFAFVRAWKKTSRLRSPWPEFYLVDLKKGGVIPQVSAQALLAPTTQLSRAFFDPQGKRLFLAQQSRSKGHMDRLSIVKLADFSISTIYPKR